MPTTPSYSDRVDRLFAAKAKLETRLEYQKLDPATVRRIKTRLGQYEVSIDRIRKGLPEHTTHKSPRPDVKKRRASQRMEETGPEGSATGATIGVPVDHIGVRD